MNNNILTWAQLECPDPKLKCILEKLVCDLSCLPESSVSAVFSGGILNITVNGQSVNVAIPTGDAQTLSLNGDGESIVISGGNVLNISSLFPVFTETQTTLNAFTLVESILSITYTGETGILQTQSINLNSLMHPELSSTNTDAPYSFNQSTQTLNIPLSSSLVDNGDGTITFTKGDGSLPQVINLIDDKINNSLIINGITFPIGTDFETILNSLDLKFVSVEVDGIDGQNSFSIPALPAITKFGQVFRNGLRKNTTEYTRTGTTFTWAIPFGVSVGAQGKETFVIDYWTI